MSRLVYFACMLLFLTNYLGVSFNCQAMPLSDTTIVAKGIVNFSFQTPQVNWKSPKNTSVSEAAFPLDFEITPIKSTDTVYTVKISLNDSLVLNEKKDSRVAARGATKGHTNNNYAKNIMLKKGKNVIKIHIENKYKVSKTTTFTINYEPLPDLYLISLGIDKYKNNTNIKNLSYAVKDVKEVAKQISKQEHFLFNNIYSYLLLDNLATKDSLLTLLTQTLKHKERETILIFMVAGHAFKRKSGTDTITYIPLYNYEKGNPATSIDVLEIDALIDKLGYTSLLIYDTCNSGYTSADIAARGKDDLSQQEVRKLFIENLQKKVVITAAIGEAYEAKNFGHGLLTQTILEATTGQLNTHLSKNRSYKNTSNLLSKLWEDGILTTQELIQFIENRLPELLRHIDKQQQPVILNKTVNFPIFKHSPAN